VERFYRRSAGWVAAPSRNRLAGQLSDTVAAIRICPCPKHPVILPEREHFDIMASRYRSIGEARNEKIPMRQYRNAAHSEFLDITLL
jgi:hypothetical protein